MGFQHRVETDLKWGQVELGLLVVPARVGREAYAEMTYG